MLVVLVVIYFFSNALYFLTSYKESEREENEEKIPKNIKLIIFSYSFLVDMVIKMFFKFLFIFFFLFKPIFLEGEKNLYFFRFVVPANLKKNLWKKIEGFVIFWLFVIFFFIKCNISKFDWLGFGFSCCLLWIRNNLTRILI